MNRQIFMPPLDSIWRLTDTWSPPDSFIDRSVNAETIHGEKRYYFDQFTAETGISTAGYGREWVKPFNEWQAAKRLERGLPKFLAGTVIVFDRYHVSHSGSHAITIRVLAAPDLLLHPKKQGGKRRGAGRLYLLLGELNTLPEIQYVDDFQAG